MSRTFKPVGGFADTALSHVRIDEHGHSYLVASDGGERDMGAVQEHNRHWAPTWTITEMENLIRDGKWQEFNPEPEATAAPVAVNDAAAQGESDHGSDTQ